MITVRNRLTALEASKACYDAGMTLTEGHSKGIFDFDAAWQWNRREIMRAVAEADDSELVKYQRV
jgi:hypothetical protein